MNTPPHERVPASGCGQFATTHWSLVRAAGVGESREALAELCQGYWMPLYVYVRRRGLSPHDAEDVTQAFFSMLLDREDLRGVDPALGKFRSFLLASMKHFLANHHQRAAAQKRGGGRAVVSLDAPSAESRCRFEPADNETPERAYERQWALTLLERTLNVLRTEAEADDKLDAFDQLKVYLTGERQQVGYAALAEQLQTTEDAVKQSVARLRKRYRRQLRREIAQTIDSPDGVEDEIRALFASLRSS